MKTFRNLIFFAFCFFAVCFWTEPTYALTVIQKDDLGNETVIVDFPASSISVSASDPMVTSQSDMPDPLTVSRYAAGLDAIMADYPFPDGANLFLVDYGQNWKNADQGGRVVPYGRYMYIFYGEYSTEYGAITNWVTNTGSASFETTDAENIEDRLLRIGGPFAVFSYDDETDKLYLLVNCYSESNSHFYDLDLEGFTAATDYDNPGYYPRIVGFSNDQLDSVTFYQKYTLGSDYFWDNFSYNYSWNGTFSTDLEVTTDFWELLQNGNWNSDNWYSEFFANALKGMKDLLEMIQALPSLFGELVSGLPEPFSAFILTCVGILVAVVVIKIAIQVVG